MYVNCRRNLPASCERWRSDNRSVQVESFTHGHRISGQPSPMGITLDRHLSMTTAAYRRIEFREGFPHGPLKVTCSVRTRRVRTCSFSSRFIAERSTIHFRQQRIRLLLLDAVFRRESLSIVGFLRCLNFSKAITSATDFVVGPSLAAVDVQ